VAAVSARCSRVAAQGQLRQRKSPFFSM
jgi:hypothetical protein